MIGKVVGTYKITDKIGEGGMGAVYLGIDTMLEREVAVKMLRPELSSQEHIVERFRAEAVTLAKLNHPNIATLYSFLQQDGDYFMVMEFVRGQTLEDHIRKNGAMDWNRAILMFCQALEGIDHAHSMGIIHRDIKPANLMITESGSVKVMDFGIARVLGTSRLTRQGGVVGTVEYMSPEQVRGLEGDARSDVYSLGILLYEMLTGRVPFQSNSEYDLMKAQIEEAPKPPRSFTPQIPLQVEQAIMRSLAKKPEARYQTAGEFRAILLGTLGASTNPLASKAAGYSAPVTKIIEPMQSAPISGDTAAAKIAEPADRGTVAYVSGIPVVGASSRSKDTLEDEASNSGPIAAPRTDERPAAPAAVATPTTSVARRGLGWKHYTAAAGVIVAAVAAAIAYVQFGSSQPAQMNDAAQPAAVVEPAPQPESANANVSDAAAALPLEPENSNESSQNVNRLDPYRHARTRDAANNNGSATAQPVDSTPEPVDTKPAQTIAQPEVQPQPQQPQVATSQNQNAAAAKDEKKKKGGGVGGFFKKVFGGGEKKNNKNAKKP
jgi:serine/threonine-protein kinase